jgi:thiamine biosynthesis lipoprotein
MQLLARSSRWLCVTTALALVVACEVPRGSPEVGTKSASREAAPAAEKRHLHRQRLLMGTLFQIQLVTGDESAGNAAIDAAFAEVARVEELISEWRDTSGISAVNRAAGLHPVEVGADMLAVAERALAMSGLTAGAFDMTFASCGQLWAFEEARIPSEAEIGNCLSRVDYRKVRLDAQRSTLLLIEPGMRIGIGGIGKGYGVDRAAAVLEELGIRDYLVDGGRDLRVRGRSPDGPWKVGIAHPRAPDRLVGALSLEGGAIVTSGDYEQYFDRAGVRYHHILNPATGRPARRSVAVTVIAPNAMDADALATGLFVMGPEAGLELVETLPGVEALFFGPDLTVRTSSGFPPYGTD